MSERQWPVVIVLGTTQTLAWASSYYLPAILADAIANDVGVSSTAFFAAFSAALLISAVMGPRIGRTIDAIGGREVLVISNLVLAGGLALLAVASAPWMLWTAWLVLGIGMALGLYDSAFATLGRIYGDKARSAITGITLIAGFASTVGWPLTALGAASIGWRNTCLAWAIAHLVLGLPLNRFLVPRPAGVTGSVMAAASGPKPQIPMDRAMWLLGIAFALGWLVQSAMAAHLPRILQAAGASSIEAVAAGALLGPAQVAARVVEATFFKRYHPIVSARLSMLMHPLASAVLGLGGGWLAGAFSAIHGTGSGIMTIARGTVPLAIFGPENYGYRMGLLGAPARILQAGAPLMFGLLIEGIGAWTLAVSTALCLIGLGALMFVRPVAR